MTALFVFAHQDDETAYLCLMRHMVAEGADIHVVWISDGAGTAPAEVRRAESLCTMGMLGLDEEKLSFWDYPDCRAIDYAGEIVGRLAAYMKDEQPSEVYTVAYEGGHPDHDFANYATVAAVAAQEEPPHAFEAPLYNAYRSRVIAVNRFIPAGTETIWTPMTLEDIRFKLRALFNYRSQFWITVVPVLLFAWPRVFGPGEPYRPVPRWNYLQPPHEGRLYYESYIMQRSMDVKFADFRRAVDSSMRSGSGE